MRRFIYDEERTRYTVTHQDYDSGFDVEVLYKSKHAGRAIINLRDNGDLILEDIVIRNDNDNSSKRINSCGHPSRPIVSVIEEISEPNPPQNFRHKGLGTELLKWVIDYVRQKGAKQIYGSVTNDDIQEQPFLLNWYKKHGFEECAPYPSHIHKAKIFLCLILI